MKGKYTEAQIDRYRANGFPDDVIITGIAEQIMDEPEKWGTMSHEEFFSARTSTKRLEVDKPGHIREV